MQMSWISSSTNLPLEGEPVQFLADGREVSLRGTYTNGVFHSRWAEYDVGRIGAWHAQDINHAVAQIVVSNRASTEKSFTVLKRLRGLIARYGVSAAEMSEPVRIDASAGSIAAPARRASALRSYANGSNQMSS